MYDELVKRLREEAGEWCVNCCYKCGDNVCGAPDDRKNDCEVYTQLQAADAIEELSKRVPPVPHGRLIDKDALEADISASVVFSGRDGNAEIVGAKKIINRLHVAPTIIPAEEGE